ncbi:MAG: OB-fold protein [Luteibaculaceae bacterium]
MAKKIILLVLVIAVMGVIYGLLEYSRTHKPTAFAKTDFSLTAQALFTEFTDDEQAANAKYLDKVLEVTGEILTVDNSIDPPQLILNSNDPMFGVICVFDGKDELQAGLDYGKTVVVKGVCAGLAMDVVLNRCAVMRVVDKKTKE